MEIKEQKSEVINRILTKNDGKTQSDFPDFGDKKNC